MKDVTVWVLTKPDDPVLGVLDEAGAGVRFVRGESAAEFERTPKPDALLICSMGRRALEPVLALCPDVTWVHSRSAGLDAVMYPGLARSGVLMTNGRGVFSRSLAEWVIGALLYFAKDFPRLERNRKSGVWEVFEPDDLAGRT